MAKKPGPEDSSPQEFAQTTPRDLHPTSDIRFVMVEVSKLTERLDNLISTVEKLSPTFEKALDKHTTDVKERLTDMKADSKETREKLGTMKESIDSFKGAMKVFAGIYALALLLGGVFLTWYLKPMPVAPAPVAAQQPPITNQSLAPAQNSN